MSEIFEPEAVTALHRSWLGLRSVVGTRDREGRTHSINRLGSLVTKVTTLESGTLTTRRFSQIHLTVGRVQDGWFTPKRVF